MRICIVGKYPPIEGGVSTHTYHYAHALARRGHEVHVVTNAREVRPPYGMYMRGQDWARCEADYGAGSVRVHWTDPPDRSQFHIPLSSAFVSKLASLTARIASDNDLEVIFSYYLEPYGVAGHLAAAIVGLPHVVKTAGSDAGRLWRHGQFAPLYDYIFKSAAMVVAGGEVAVRLRAIGVEVTRIRSDRGRAVPLDTFTPETSALEIDALVSEVAQDPGMADLVWGKPRGDRPYLGIYGKLGETKGTFAMLEALARLAHEGRDFGLLVMGHPRPHAEKDFRAEAKRLGLAERIVQLPFLPNWRVSEFHRRCLAVCCLEQGFPIAIHAPIMPREVLASGTCLIGSTEVIRKLPQPERMVDGYNCLAIEDVNDTPALATKIAAVLDDPDGAARLGRRGRAYVADVQQSVDFPLALERILEQAMGTPRPITADKELPILRMAIEAVGWPGSADETDEVRRLHEELDERVAAGDMALAPLADAVRLEWVIAEAMGRVDGDDPLFRLRIASQMPGSDALRESVPVLRRDTRIETFDYDVNILLAARRSCRLPSDLRPSRSRAAFLKVANASEVRTLVLGNDVAALVDCCDGRATLAEIATTVARSLDHGDGAETWALETLENLFARGLLELRQGTG